MNGMGINRVFCAVIICSLFLGAAACNKVSATTSADSTYKPASSPPATADNAKAEPRDEPKIEPETEPAAPTKAATVVPAGTKLRIALINPVSSDKSHKGDSFSASLAEPVVIDDSTVLKTGTKLRGSVVDAKESGRVKGRASLELKLTAIVLSGGKVLSISTKPYTVVAESTKKRDAGIIGGGAGLGALIGAFAGGGKGAAIGAGVGAGAGTGTVLATKGKEIRYAPETRLQFTLAKPVEL